MDLQEIVNLQSRRHPWEKVRAKSIKKLLKEFAPTPFRILDIGCGDGYIADQIVKDFAPSEYIGFDTNLSSEQIDTFSKRNPRITFSNSSKEIAGKQFDLALLLDVLEHIEEDDNYLQQIVTEHLTKGSKMLITVPAFQFLYGSHDSILGHHRRYTQQKLQSIVKNTQCKTLASGYMFASLFLIRTISVFLQKISNRKKPEYSGVGKWNSSPLLSKYIEHVLMFDNQILFSVSKLGYLIPGLTLWTLCEKQR